MIIVHPVCFVPVATILWHMKTFSEKKKIINGNGYAINSCHKVVSSGASER